VTRLTGSATANKDQETLKRGLRNKKIKRMGAFVGAAIIVGGLCLLQYVRANGYRLYVSVPPVDG
jgi:hypothetical protein